MQEKLLFEYAVIRVVPRVEREEFLNVGVVVYCAARKFLEAAFEVNDQRLFSLSPTLDMGEINEYIDAFTRICKGDKTAGTIACLPPAERFRWLTATRSTIIQSSKVHSGLCENLGETLSKLYVELVL
jgi:hypothetical protein